MRNTRTVFKTKPLFACLRCNRMNAPAEQYLCEQCQKMLGYHAQQFERYERQLRGRTTRESRPKRSRSADAQAPATQPSA
jgi:hypothetical protein